MSTGLECEFVEYTPGTWYYVLQYKFPSAQEEDWWDYAHAFGPFASYDAAWDHLRRTQPNPGGHLYSEYDPQYMGLETLRNLIAEAEDPQQDPRF